MSNINEKLINYGNLSTFHSNLINDSSVSVKSTWSSSKISEELSNVQSDPIVDVSVLPDAGENKSKLFRLESDDNVYVSELIGTSTEEVNAPDSEQIDNAYIHRTVDLVGDYVYKGIIIAYFIDGSINLHCWQLGEIEDEINIFSVESAADINSINDVHGGIAEDFELYWNDTENKYISTDYTVAEAQETAETLLVDLGLGLSINIVKQTVTTETWAWKRIVTEDEIITELGIDESTLTGATLTVDGSQPSIVASGSTTIVWDDLASSIPSGKSVEVSIVLINTGNSALTPTMSGNYQMMGDGNITIQPLELGLYKAKYISSVDVWLVEAINQEVSGTVE